jgi:hypothetical protein
MMAKVAGVAFSVAVASAFSVSTEGVPAVTVDGVKVPETPVGRSCTLSVIVSPVPASFAVLMVSVFCPPCATPTVAGVGLNEKSFAAQRGNLTVAIRVSHWNALVVL